MRKSSFAVWSFHAVVTVISVNKSYKIANNLKLNITHCLQIGRIRFVRQPRFSIPYNLIHFLLEFLLDFRMSCHDGDESVCGSKRSYYSCSGCNGCQNNSADNLHQTGITLQGVGGRRYWERRSVSCVP